MKRLRLPAAIFLALIASSHSVGAQPASGPVYVRPVDQVPAPLDRPFIGTIELHVDATDVERRIFSVHQRIPVAQSGTMTLLYPRWEFASHGPSLTVSDLAGLVVEVAGKPIKWRRDRYEPHAFHIEVPPGASTIDVRFQMVAAGDAMTPEVVATPWQKLILYPAGWYARNIPINASLKLPEGLRAFTSLKIERKEGSTFAFAATSLETLLDSPVLAGRHTAQIPLTKAGRGSVALDLVALRPGDLSVPVARLAELEKLIAQMKAVFGDAPFERYDILARLSDDGSSGGTEHRSSGEIGLASAHLQDWPGQILSRDLIAHEIIHAWNGFYRTPADLWAPTPNVPVSGSLLWVYEGQTEFWGRILATRAGQFTPEELRDRLALEAAEIAARKGRAWRSLSDDVNYPSFMLRQPVPWRDWQRRRDYYSEGVMLWLAVDAELRERSAGRRNIDDFARRFFAGATPDAPTRTYTFDDICDVLNAIAPGDWKGFLLDWIDGHDELDTSVGLNRHGWRLVFTETPTDAFRANEEEAGVTDLTYSIGLTARPNGTVRSVAWDSPTFRLGLRAGAKILRVNDIPFSRDALLSAVGQSATRPIVLTVEQDARQSKVRLPYAGPLRYPRLERIADSADTLAALLAPR